jgi:LysM repeat protein
MKAPLLCTALALVFGAAPAFSKTELEMLREENRALKAEIAQLKGLSPQAPISRQEVTSSKPVATAKAATYTVVAGDSLARIARRSNCSVKSLMAANQLKKTMIHPGQVLKLPNVVRPAPAAIVEVPKISPAVAAKPASAPKKATERDLVKPSLPTVVSNTTPKTPSTSVAATSAKPSAPQETAIEANVSAPVPRITGPILAKRSVIIETQTTYGDFAAKHQTTAEQLNALNGFSLSPTTVLAKGSEIDVPAQP